MLKQISLTTLFATIAMLPITANAAEEADKTACINEVLVKLELERTALQDTAYLSRLGADRAAWELATKRRSDAGEPDFKEIMSGERQQIAEALCKEMTAVDALAEAQKRAVQAFSAKLCSEYNTNSAKTADTFTKNMRPYVAGNRSEVMETYFNQQSEFVTSKKVQRELKDVNIDMAVYKEQQLENGDKLMSVRMPLTVRLSVYGLTGYGEDVVNCLAVFRSQTPTAENPYGYGLVDISNTADDLKQKDVK